MGCCINVMLGLRLIIRNNNKGLPGSSAGRGSFCIAQGATPTFRARNSHALWLVGLGCSGRNALVTSLTPYAQVGAAKLPSVGRGRRERRCPSAESSFTSLLQGTILMIGSRMAVRAIRTGFSMPWPSRGRGVYL